MAWQYYGNWGGPGWSDGHYTVPGENINWSGVAKDKVDEVFRDHDHAYDNAKNSYKNSDKSAAARSEYWRSIIAADAAVKDALVPLVGTAGLSAEANAAALAAIDAFVHKQWAYNIPSLVGNIDPDVGLGTTAVDTITGMRIPGVIGILVNTSVTLAINWVAPRRDPLVLDLDGGGITTSGINPAAPILFDMNGDDIKTATGWIASGEAIVVRDLNGNGTIDSGRELFGDNTILTTGARAGQTAANGFEALADLDSNADGKFDSSDAAFASVKLWRDTNQNGISEAGELFSFASQGVASINTTGTASNVNLVNGSGQATGNTQTHAGTFTKVGGAVGNAATAELAGSLLLANNNFYREFTDDPALTTAARALPQMQGSGLVRDLRPAMSLGNAQALALQTQLTQYAEDTTKAQQLAHLDGVIQSWGATSAMQTSVQINRTIANYGGPNVLDVYGATAIEKFSLDNPDMYAKITALEQFNGINILSRWVRNTTAWYYNEQDQGWRQYTYGDVVFSAPQADFINQAYDALKTSVYGALVTQTRLKPYLDSIGKSNAIKRIAACARSTRARGRFGYEIKALAQHTSCSGVNCLLPIDSPQTPAKPLRFCAVRAETGCTRRAQFGTRRFCPPRPQGPSLLVKSQLSYGTPAHCLRAV